MQIQKGIAVLAVVLLIAKLVAYYLTHSVAVLTDAMESIVNVVASFIGLYSLYLSAKPADKDHPYGHGKIEFVSASVEGSMIFLAGFMIFYKSIENLVHPVSVHQLDTGMVLISATALANYVAGALCIKTGKRNNSIALIASGKHLQSDTYSTVGILLGLGLLYVTQIQWLDSVVALLFSIVIVHTGYSIVRKSVAGIMDEADKELLTSMVNAFNKNRSKNWIDLHNLRVIKYGSLLHLDCHLTVPWYFNVKEAHDEIEALGCIVRNEFGDAIELFVHSDSCTEVSCKICEKKDCTVRQQTFEKKIEWTIDNISSDSKHTVNS